MENSGLSVSSRGYVAMCAAAENNIQSEAVSRLSALQSPFIADDSLCAAGNRWNSDLNNRGNNGNYWSSTQNPDNANNAYNLNFNSNGANWNNNWNRNNGQSVRPVTEFPTEGGNMPPKSPIPFTLSREQLLHDLIKAYMDARRHKRRKPGAARFELDMEEQLVALRDEIYERRYEPSPYTCFVIKEPKVREIFAADFRDRVVHHLLYNYIYSVLDRSFIADSYSCRVGKGTTCGIDRLTSHIRRCSRSYTRACYVMKMDIRGYFMSINRSKLLGLVRAQLAKCARRRSAPRGKCWAEILDFDTIGYLSEVIIMNDPLRRCIRKGPDSDWQQLPPTKSLYHSAAGYGLPIGNLTSQLFSNVYLNGFDHYMKRTLRCRHYGRYVDDFFVVDSDRSSLRCIRTLAEGYLRRELLLSVHPDKTMVRDAVAGVDFLGAYIKPYRSYLRNSTLCKMSHKIARLKEETGRRSPQSVRDSLNSFLGLMKRYRTHRLRRSLFDNYSEWDAAGLFNSDLSHFLCYRKLFANPPHTLTSECLRRRVGRCRKFY